jgi:class 3 adenylate cyclase
MTGDLSRRAVAERAGVGLEYVDRIIELGILPARQGDTYSLGDVRRVRVVEGLERGGMTLDLLGEAFRRGDLSLDFVDQPNYDRFAGHEDVTFRQLSERTAIPLELLLVVREAMGSALPGPDDRVREVEMRVVPFLEIVLQAGVRPAMLDRTLRVGGDALRRLAETEADWWWTDILQPLFGAQLSAAEIGEQTAVFATTSGPPTDDAVLAIYHGQQTHAWMRNIFEGFESILDRAGLLTRIERPPAIVFFDVTGYSRLTEERGDEQAAELAGRVARLVQRTSAEHDGKAVKWLGDGVMLHFRDPGLAVVASLDMLDDLAKDGLPQGHVGVHAGPILFQEGDYFGRTVNAAARISDHATGGEVLVSQQVVDAAEADGVAYEPIGPVELKGLLTPLVLYRARRRAPG